MSNENNGGGDGPPGGPPSSIMSFPQYRNFPPELRLQIIEEFVQAFNTRRGRLSRLATVDREWNQVIEGVLFSKIKMWKGEIREFSRYCSSRQHLVSSVVLSLRLNSSMTGAPDDLAQNERTVKRNISELFHAIKDWDRSETPDRLLTLFIALPDRHFGFRNVWTNAYDIRTIACDFEGLPNVPVIGKLFTHQPFDGLHLIGHSTLDAVHRRLPNLRSASLDLPTMTPVQETIDIARSRMMATHRTNPNLRMLSINQDPSLLPGYGAPDFEARCREDEIKIARSLTPMIFLWGETLVFLKLDCLIDIPQFLSTASKSWWPNLRILQLAAILDEDEGSDAPFSGGLDPEKQYRAPQEALQGLTAALPFMRSLMKIDIQFRDPTTGFWACCICVNLFTKTDLTELVYHPPRSIIMDYFARHTAIVPCRCGAMIEGPTLVTRDLALPGKLVSDLQEAVQQYRLQDLAAWCCRITQLRWGRLTRPFLPCTQWNKDTSNWDFSFMNDMDVFIWQMGYFWLQLDRSDFLKDLDPPSFRRMLDEEYEEDFGQ